VWASLDAPVFPQLALGAGSVAPYRRDSASSSRATKPTRSPAVADRARAGVGRRVRGELAVKLGEPRDVIGKPQLHTHRRQRGVMRWGCTIDEPAARQRPEPGEGGPSVVWSHAVGAVLLQRA